MPAGRHFLQIPGPTNVPDRVLRAIDRPTIDHRGPEFQALGKEVLEGVKRIFQTTLAGDHLSRLGHRRVGSGAREHALARRQGAHGRDRPFRHALAEDGEEARARHRVHPRRLAPWRERRRDRGEARRRQGARHQGRVRGAQRDLHGRREQHRARCARPSTRRSIPRCSWWTRSPRSPRSTTATTNGAWT